MTFKLESKPEKFQFVTVYLEGPLLDGFKEIARREQMGIIVADYKKWVDQMLTRFNRGDDDDEMRKFFGLWNLAFGKQSMRTVMKKMTFHQVADLLYDLMEPRELANVKFETLWEERFGDNPRFVKFEPLNPSQVEVVYSKTGEDKETEGFLCHLDDLKTLFERAGYDEVEMMSCFDGAAQESPENEAVDALLREAEAVVLSILGDDFEIVDIESALERCLENDDIKLSVFDRIFSLQERLNAAAFDSAQG